MSEKIYVICGDVRFEHIAETVVICEDGSLEVRNAPKTVIAGYQAKYWDKWGMVSEEKQQAPK